MIVLLVEDDPSIAGSLTDGLERYGYEVRWVTTGRAALEADGWDVVLLDLGLPDMDGLDVCRELRARSGLPIIIVTARDDEVDTVAGLEVGADDYVAKPFGVREIVARIRAVTRRLSATDPGDPVGAADAGPDGPVPALVVGRVSVDVAGRRVHDGGEEVRLSPKEFDLLAALALEPGTVLTREALIERVWDTHWFGSTRTLDVHIAALRQKLAGAVVITTLRGVGFRLEAA
ncbi:response regulator transcription factor [Clavibacter michiganensis]|uniref:response regulator transcription factor n=1 Tax=Clavibacter michiganensis TaxID=28447 RepID=UPI0005B91EEB|nr:response regulator transcription factor [Clavibacter michiganensis]